MLCIGFESADFCLHSFTTVEKSKISVSPNDCGGRFVYRYYIILSTVILLFSAIIIAATITEVQSVQVSSTIVTTYHVYNLDK